MLRWPWRACLLCFVASERPEEQWRDWVRELFVDFLQGIGCEQCDGLLEPGYQLGFSLSSNIFGCRLTEAAPCSAYSAYES